MDYIFCSYSVCKNSIVSGGFDPVHVGHLELFERARSIADDLFVIVNDDTFLEHLTYLAVGEYLKERTKTI